MTELEQVVAPELVLRPLRDKPHFLGEKWNGGSRPELLARVGLWALFPDCAREITYSRYATHEQALEWLCSVAKMEPQEVIEVRYWEVTELLRWANYQARLPLRGEELEQMLGPNK